jgi:hypothetical protein
MLLAVHPASSEESFEYWPGASYDPAIPTLKAVLGYEPGERIYSHGEMMAYMDALAESQPNRVKIFEYARSWEDRKLIYVVIGSEANIARLDEIQEKMQQLADPRKTTPEQAKQIIDSVPAITWLAYNIHGNEISSPNASLLVAYHLLAAQNDDMVSEIFEKTLVIIDPTQNPDGKDRFVHNFRIAHGLEADSHPLAAEHDEPWPGGRTNHYYFDMNRDFFALTQPETLGRVRAYQKWFPQVVADLHEMGGNSTYYFAPGADPYNPHITSLQETNIEIYGKNNAKWFDHFGFEYFTREVFDEFYPGYGASWPLFQGFLGMTYEQASARGLVYRRYDGTDLTFRDTVHHHFVASIATAETTAKNCDKLLADFFEYRRTAVEEGRTESIREYILPPTGDLSALTKMVGLLVEQGIDVRRSTSSFNACGESYPAGSYAISLAQPTKRLIRTLLDTDVAMEEEFMEEQERRRKKKLGDQIYDVTAWSLPLMYNLECVACGEVVTGEFEPAGPELVAPGRVNGKASLAYLVPWGTAASARFLAAALREDLRIFTSDKTFTQKGTDYPRGTLIINVDDNPADLHPTLERLAASTGADLFATDTAWVEKGVNFGSNNVLHVRRPRVAMAWDFPTSSGSAGATRFVLERQFGYPVTPIRTLRLANADLSVFDVLILPEGSYAPVFNENTAKRLKDWVSSGGTLIGVGRALGYLTNEKVGLLAVSPENKVAEDGNQKGKNDAPKGSILASEEDYLAAIQPKSERPDNVPGVLAIAKLDPDNWITAGLEGTVNILFRGRSIYPPIPLDKGVNAAVFVGPDELLASGYLWEENRKQIAYKPAVIVQNHGRGLVVGFVSDPNFRAYLDGLNVLFLNAVFRGPARARPAVTY